MQMNTIADGTVLHPALQRVEHILARRPFVPHRLLRSAHLQTVIASRLPRQFPWGWRHSSEHILELDGECRVRAVLVDRSPEAPTLIGLHGLGGSSESGYMRGLSHKAYREGWNAALFNLYDMNLGGRRPTLFHAGSSSRIEEMLDSVRRIRPWQSFYLAGISMGGNLLLKLMGDWGDAPPRWVRGATVISPLVDLVTSWRTLEEPSNAFYRFYFIHRLKRALRGRSRELERFIDLNALNRVRTIRDFDEHVTAPLGGYNDAFDYYRRASSAPLLKQIRVPTLVIHAKDDPLLPWEPWTRPEPLSNPWLFPHLTENGGHVGFIEHTRSDIDRAWAENRAIDFFRLLAARSG